MKLYIIVHSNDKTKPGAWNSAYMGGVEITQVFTSIEDVKKFLDFGNPVQEKAMRLAWRVVEVDLEKCEPQEIV